MKQQIFPVVFLGTDNISLQCLNLLVEKPEFAVKAVITQKIIRTKKRGIRPVLSPLIQRVKELSLPLLTPDDLQSSDFLYEVKNLKADWAILLSYGKILPGSFLSLFPKRALNFHARFASALEGCCSYSTSYYGR